MKPDTLPLDGDVHSPQDCQTVRELLARIGDKWTVIVVTRLKLGPMRFSELRRALPSISQKMLTSTLRALERDGFIERVVTPTIPPRVDYKLTELGVDLLEPLDALADWALRNHNRVLAARQSSDSRETE